RTLRIPAEIERRYGIPVLGIIPGLEMESGKLNLDSDSKILEPYRNLRTNINYSVLVAAKSCKNLIITSALQGEGKTTKAVNLAICFSFDGKKVLLVDADLRRPSVHALLDQKKDLGFAEYLTGQAEFKDVLKPTKFNGLTITPAGNKMPNPAEILGSPRINSFIEDASKVFDLVFFDSPAIFPVTDALVLAPKMDGALVVFRSNYTPVKVGEEVLRKLNQVGASVIGGVLNDVRSGKGRYYYSYYGYYGYSYYKNYYEESHPNVKYPWVHAIKNVAFDKMRDIKESSKGKIVWGQFRLPIQKLFNWSIFSTLGLILAVFAFIWVYKLRQAPDFIPLGTAPPGTIKAVKPGETVISDKMNVGKDSMLILEQIKNWSNGLGQLNLPLYLSTYSVVKYKYKDGGYSDWKKKKIREFEKVQAIHLKVQNIDIQIKGRKAISQFLQELRTNGKTRQALKVQYWEKEEVEGKLIWLITKEGIKRTEKELGTSDYVHDK
ncbi:CpsD/CapB family tyrosine-protein kinase, partial [Fibrobacterota bacterium]